MRLKQNKKGISTVVAVSIILAALVTVAATFQTFVVPQLDRDNAFAHSQSILNSFEQLYSAGSSTIQLSYSGTPFFSASYYPGQLSYTPAVTLTTSYINANGSTTYSANGALLYQTNTFPLAYMATPWGVTAIEAGTSAISGSQVNWAQNTLTLNIYNITGFSGTVSGSGSIGISFAQQQAPTSLTSTFSLLTLNFASTDSTLNQSIYQIAYFLENNAPTGTTVTFSHSQTSAEITIQGSDSITLLLHNVTATTS